jgi:hypothetical protein
MITEGGSRSNERGYFDWELDDQVANENNELVACEGVCPGSAKEMLQDMEAMAAGFTGKNYICHFSQNNKEDRNLTEDEELMASYLARKSLGLLGMPYFIKRHTHSDGSRHTHTVVLRVKNGTAVNGDFRDAYTMYDISRECERDLNLRRIEDVASRATNAQRRTKWQVMKAGDNGVSLDQMDMQLQKLKDSCATGKDFALALPDMQIILARGDKVRFMTVDHTCAQHKLRVQLNMKQSELDKYMSSVDHKALPTVSEARAMQNAAQKALFVEQIKPIWKEHAKSTPDKLIKSVIDCGFVVARAKKGGVYLCVARNGKYVSLQRAAGVGKSKFDNFMRGVDRDKLPDLAEARAIQAARKQSAITPVIAVKSTPTSSSGVLSRAPTPVKSHSGIAMPAPSIVGISTKIGAALLAAGRVDPVPAPPVMQQPVELQRLPDKKPRVQAVITKQDRSSVEAVVQEYSGRIDLAAKTDPDSVAGIQAEMEGIISKIIEGTQVESAHNQDEIDKANTYNQTLELEEQWENERVEKENAKKISQAKLSQAPPRSFEPGM